MFAGEGSAVADDQVGGFFYEFAEFGDAGFRLKIEVEAGVDAGVAEVAVERAFVVEGVHHFAEVAEITPKFFGGDGGVFPAFPVQGLAGDVRGYAETGFANFPDAFGLLAGEQLHVRRIRAVVQNFDERVGLRLGFLNGLAAELDHEPASAFGEQGEAFGIRGLGAGVIDEEVVEAFEADGMVRHDFGDVIGALENVGIGDYEEHSMLRAFDEAAGGFEDCGAGSFGADEGAGDVESVFGEEIVEVVAGDAAGDLGEFLADEIGVGGGDLL